MDTSVLKKRLSTFKSAQGHLHTLTDEIILEVLKAWEQWPGATADLYRDLGIKKGQLSSIIRRAKKLVKNGATTEGEFKEIDIDTPLAQSNLSRCPGAEVVWDSGKIIRFSDLNLLLDFLKKAA